MLLVSKFSFFVFVCAGWLFLSCRTHLFLTLRRAQQVCVHILNLVSGKSLSLSLAHCYVYSIEMKLETCVCLWIIIEILIAFTFSCLQQSLIKSRLQNIITINFQKSKNFFFLFFTSIDASYYNRRYYNSLSLEKKIFSFFSLFRLHSLFSFCWQK